MTIKTNQAHDELSEIEELLRDQTEHVPQREPVAYKPSPEADRKKTWFLIHVVALTVCVVAMAYVVAS